MSDSLAQVKLLKGYAKANRDFARFEDAIKDLEKATKLLLPVYERAEDSNYKITLSKELADCYGMMGGIYRRQAQKGDFRANLEKSAQMYEKGLSYEIDDSYNLTNTIVLKILLDPENLVRQQERIKRGIETVEKQVCGKRVNQWWAWADLGLLYLLAGKEEETFKGAYKTFMRLGTRTQDFESTLLVLEDLRKALEGITSPFAIPVAKSLATAIQELKDNKPR